MKKSIIFLSLAALLAAAACHREQGDTRYFAPAVSFGSSSYSVNAGDGGLDIDLKLSRPASQDLTVGLNISSSLELNQQYQVSATALRVATGEQSASLHISLTDDEIWVESSWIELVIVPGQRYTVDPANNSTARVNVNKKIEIPIIGMVQPEAPIVTNPYLAEVLHFQLTANRAPISAVTVLLDFDGLAYGKDYLIPGSSASSVELPAGATSLDFDVQILKKDLSGYDKETALTLLPSKGKYSVSADSPSVSVHLSDPSISFKPIFKTAALQSGQGFQIRQAFLAKDGSWSGNIQVDLGVSSEGSNYLRNFKNLYDHPSFSCKATASVSQMFRLSELFPLYVYPNATAILDYGNDQNHRQFSPADSLMRFVLDKGETAKGKIYLEKPRTFVARVGSYAAWQDKSSGSNAWVLDSRATGGNLMASTHPALTGNISVTLEKLEGSFDFTNSSEPVLVTAWFSSDSPLFMKPDEANNKDPEASYDITQENGLWKVRYKLWPR